MQKLALKLMVALFLLQAGWAQAWVAHGAASAADAHPHAAHTSHDVMGQQHDAHPAADGTMKDCQQHHHHAGCVVILGQIRSIVMTASRMPTPCASNEALRDFWAADIDKPKWAATTV